MARTYQELKKTVSSYQYSGNMARTYQEAKDVTAAAARTERHRARLRDNGAGLNFFDRKICHDVDNGGTRTSTYDNVDDAGGMMFMTTSKLRR